MLLDRKKGGTKFENGLFKSAAARFLMLLGGIAVIFAVVFLVQGIYIRDRAIAYQDAFARLLIITGYVPNETASLYEIGFEKSMHLIKNAPIFGAGPDCMAKMLSLSEELILNSIDRSYNEYLYVAATRGIPSAIAFAAFVVYVVRRGFVGLKGFVSDSSEWYRPAAMAAVTAYAVQAFFSASSVTVAPLFWLFCGIICAKGIDKAVK